MCACLMCACFDVCVQGSLKEEQGRSVGYQSKLDGIFREQVGPTPWVQENEIEYRRMQLSTGELNWVQENKTARRMELSTVEWNWLQENEIARRMKVQGEWKYKQNESARRMKVQGEWRQENGTEYREWNWVQRNKTAEFSVYLELARTVYMHHTWPYTFIFGYFPAKITVYTPYIYDSGQSYA